MRGEQLSREEHLQLDKWYVVQDGKEISMIGLVQQIQPSNNLQIQIEAALNQLVTITNRIKKIEFGV